MAELVVLQGMRPNLTEEQDRLVNNLEELLRKARNGDIRGMVYATVGEDKAITLGVLNAQDVGLHEHIGLSQMLNSWLLTAADEVTA